MRSPSTTTTRREPPATHISNDNPGPVDGGIYILDDHGRSVDRRVHLADNHNDDHDALEWWQ